MISRKTFTLRFKRFGKTLDIEIHPDWRSCSSSALSYVNCFFSARSSSKFERHIRNLTSDVGPVHWGDGEYEVIIDCHDAVADGNDRSPCKIIPFGRPI